MEIRFIGTGSAFTLGADNYQSNILIETKVPSADEEQEKLETWRLLIDCGSDARFALEALGMTYLDINDVYVSHLHADHAGGLEWFGFCTKFDPRVTVKPQLFISKMLRSDLWNKTLSGGMGSIQNDLADLNTYFDVVAVKPNSSFAWCGIEFQIVQTVHIMNGFTIVPSFGLIFEAGGKKIFITTDTQFCPEQIKDFYRDADIIFQDCETSPFKSGVHANYVDLVTLEPNIKKKMWLYHYQPGDLPDAVADGFLGFVERGQGFDF